LGSYCNLQFNVCWRDVASHSRHCSHNGGSQDRRSGSIYEHQVIAGWVIIQQPGGRLLHFDTLGYMCIGLMVACGVCMYVINGQILTMVHIKQVNKENKIELVA